ncbi:MAG: hypothetical protein JRN67_13680 [Nitrososphaerota archaeon]|nr:hypothetical protein [Nitrososphaerota archaeon]
MSFDVDTQSKMDEMLETEKIEAIMRQARPQVAVIGVGGAGCNIVSWVKGEEGRSLRREINRCKHRCNSLEHDQG